MAAGSKKNIYLVVSGQKLLGVTGCWKRATILARVVQLPIRLNLGSCPGGVEWVKLFARHNRIDLDQRVIFCIKAPVTIRKVKETLLFHCCHPNATSWWDSTIA